MLFVMAVACLGCVVGYAAVVSWRWLRVTGVPGALAGVDAVCRFLVCYEGGGDTGRVQPLPAVFTNPEAEAQITWAVARWPQLAS